MELLIVIAIIGALTALSLPAIKGISQSQTANNASRQLMDDLNLARHYAIKHRSEVHVLFVPPAITNMTFSAGGDVAKRLMSGIYTSYAIYAERTIGDQPGQRRPRYLSKWKSLPDGMFIAPREFARMSFKDWDQQTDPLGRPFLYANAGSIPNPTFPFPTLTNAFVVLPHITFDPQGRVMVIDDLGNRQYRDEMIELARGSIMATHDNAGNLTYFDVRESPVDNSIINYVRVRVDGLTGRATLERPEL